MRALTAVDGGQVEISAGPLAVNYAEATMFGVWAGELGRHEVAVGNLGFAEETGAREGITFTEKYGLRDGTAIGVGHRTATDAITKLSTVTVLGMWSGAAHTVRLFVQGGGSVGELTNELLAVFDTLELAETDSGVVINSRDTSAADLETAGPRAPDVVCHVPGLGLVAAMQRTTDQAWQVPVESGASAAGGAEIWTEGREGPEGNGNPALIFRHVSATAITRIVADSARVGERTLVSRARSLATRWRGPTHMWN